MKVSLKYNSLLFLLLGIAITLVSCDKEERWIKNTELGEALGTTYSIIYISKDTLNLQRQIDSVFSVVNQSMSTYIPGSDISRINRGDSTVVVDEMFREVLALSRDVYRTTNGYFDPTVGILVNAWGFGPGHALAMDSAEVNRLKMFVGLDKIELTGDNQIRKKYPEMQLDFNAIAKGYAIDRLAVMLDQNQIENYLVEVGGEIVTKGINQLKEQAWVVGIDDPQVEQGRRLKITLNLRDEALASSGNYRKFRIDSLTGEKFVHTIDPKSGFTRNSNVLAASVIASKCAMADAYATAFMTMELDSSIAFLEGKKELEAYLIYIDPKGEEQEYFTPGFLERVRK
ncbi:MAG: FAD:protein FMN transferase [Muriicola sp.]|nr:FAD:protein FMN transferase [Muriicola sp.]NNK36534.1 FAD:protein FMN transferase [Eudoraea sp.]